MKKCNIYRKENHSLTPGPLGGYLDQAEYWLLIHLAVGRAGTNASPEDIFDEFKDSRDFPYSKREIRDMFRELTVGGYLRRVTEDPETYRLTPAGCDAIRAYDAGLGQITEEDDQLMVQETVH